MMLANADASTPQWHLSAHSSQSVWLRSRARIRVRVCALSCACQRACVRARSGASARSSALSHQVLEDGLVHGGKGSAARTLLLRLPLARRGLAHNAALTDDHHVLTAELLLELQFKAARRHTPPQMSVSNKESKPQTSHGSTPSK
eukprot:6194851-Pleurochrysis_carterae.AAC.4